MSSAASPASRLYPLPALLLFFAATVAVLIANAADVPTRASDRALKLPVPTTGRTGFTQVDGPRAGIRFANNVRGELIRQNNNFMQGSGVAAGDFDQDGRCDLYFCAIDGANALYRNLGNWRFEDVTAKAGVGCAGLHCTGAAFADVDGDGNLDLLVTSLGNGVHLFINEGNGRFHETTAEAGLASRTGSMSLALADVDGDGDLDLYVANYGTQAILRSGGGSAQMRRGPDGQWTILGPYADRLRFVNGRLEELGEPDVLYLNDGHGHFQPVPWNSDWFVDQNGKPVPAPWDFGLTVQMRDINGDGAPDIYVCNDFQTPDRLWLNDGRGHFRALPRLARRHESFAAMGVDFADIDRDGRLDFMVVEMMSREHPRRMREVSGMQLSIPMVGRFDNLPEVTRNTLYWNQGDGTYAEIALYAGVAATDWSWHPVFLDVDLDGYEDLLIPNGISFDVQDRDVLNRVRSQRGQTLEQSRTNIMLYPPFDSPNYAFSNRHDLTFAEVGRDWGFDSTRISQGLALVDLDQDGDLDVVVNCLNNGPLLYRNETTAPRVAVRLRGLKGNPQGIGGVIRVEGGPAPNQAQEILCGGRYLSSDEPLRTFAAGSLTNRLSLEVRWRGGKRSFASNALPNYLYEFDEANAQPAPPVPTPSPPHPFFKNVSDKIAHLHHEEFYVDYARQPLLMKQLSQLGPGLAWFDLEHDGHDLLVTGTGKGGPLQVFRPRGSGAFEKLDVTWSAPDDVTGLVGWVFADGRRALLAAVANYETAPTNHASVVALTLPAKGAAPVVSPPLGTLASSPGPLAAADIDGDGNLELFIGGRVVPGAYPKDPESLILRQAKGALVVDPVNTPVLKQAGMVSGAVWSDLDGDGFPELVLACEWGPIRIYRNHKGRLTPWDAPVSLNSQLSTLNSQLSTLSSQLSTLNSQLSTLSSLTTGWWNSVATGDFDGDGRLDIIAGNWGLNTGYEAAPAHPLHLYYGELSGTGVTDLIEAYYAPELDAVVPRRTLNALGQAFPALLAHFKTHEAYSTASISQVLQVIGSPARQLTAVTLANLLFLNRTTGFVAVPLPAQAQFAPVFGINVGDFDGDGREDVFLAQNFFAMRPEWPRLDGGRGLWLRGDGQGGLALVSATESGVQVYGEQRGSALGDFDQDGRIDLAVSQNGAATQLYQNVGARPGLRVRLRGPTGNPDGVGATVRLEYADGRLGPAREIHGGGGYWSQDSLVPVLGLAGQAAKVRVRWPGGRQTVRAVPEGAREIIVD